MELSPEVIYKATIPVVFSFVVLVSCFRVIYKGDDATESYKKIIGGLGVFLVAIIADNPYIYTLSFFIGGLLIASERFLLTLASILRANREDLKEIANSYRELSADEVRKKIIYDVGQSSSLSSPKNNTSSQTAQKKLKAQPSTSDSPTTETLEAESAVMNHVKHVVEDLRKVNLRLKQFVSVPVNSRKVAFDAIAIKPSTNEVVLAIETRFIKVGKSHTMTLDNIESLANQFKSYNLKSVLCIVISNYNLTLVNKLLKLKEKFSNDLFGIALYEWSRQEVSYKKLQVIDESELESKLPDKLLPF